MAPTKRASNRKNQASKRRSAALPVLGAAGLSFAMTSSTSATVPATDLSSQGAGPGFALGEEEISDVSLATFYVFDKEHAAPPLRLAAGCGAGCGCSCGCACAELFQPQPPQSQHSMQPRQQLKMKPPNKRNRVRRHLPRGLE